MATIESLLTPTRAPGRVVFLDGQNEMAMVEVNTAASTAAIYLHGAQVTHFQRGGEAPLLFMSQFSRFAEGQPIRGGVPIVFPWFGAREGLPQHGFARIHEWEVKEFAPAPDGSVSVRFCLPECPEASTLPAFTAEYTVTVSDWLGLRLSITNRSDAVFTFEDCLHTYFEVGDVTAVSVAGLEGRTYLDQTAKFAQRTESTTPIRIASEVDRIYLNTVETVEIADPRLGRKILIEKEGSASTVVWNPWVAKSQQMPDFGNDEYSRMLCVESGNVAPNEIALAPGQTHTLAVRISTKTLT